jgi:hypothetical protein
VASETNDERRDQEFRLNCLTLAVNHSAATVIATVPGESTDDVVDKAEQMYFWVMGRRDDEEQPDAAEDDDG